MDEIIKNINTDRETVTTSKLPEVLPLLTTNDLVIFPGVITPVVVKDESKVRMVSEVLSTENKYLVVALLQPESDDDERSTKPYGVGCASSVIKMLRIPDGTLRLLVQGLARVKLRKLLINEENYPEVLIGRLKTSRRKGIRIDALTRTLRDDFNEVIDTAPYLPTEMKIPLINISDPGALADFVAMNLNIKIDQRQEILSTLNVEDRLTKISRYVSRELQILKLSNKIQSEVAGSIEKNQREYFLREQLKAIRRELGEDNEGAEIRELKKRADKLAAPDPVREKAQQEVDRMSKMNQASAEYTVARTYIDWLLDLPWEVSTEDRIDISAAKTILDDDHYGLDDVKERILEYLAVKKLKGEGRGSILCFVGPPGVGKTSIGKSIATAMGRKFVRMSLGGLRDEAEVRGHRRTYIGALPGRIIQNIKRARTNNPVFMLDEIDKLGSDFRGDPSSAMLEVLDPEQNFAFQDNYLEVDFDLSRVMFITTANYLETIPPPLRDRMEIIKLPGYITPEKVQIARRYLVPRQISENGLKRSQISLTDKALENIVVYYTREAGVRSLERTIGKICRKVAIKVSLDEGGKFSISNRNLSEYLGSQRVIPDLFNRKPRVGVATGLAWTQVGGVMLVIEVISMPGEGLIKITGQLGDVMKESAEIAMSYLKKRADKLNIPKDYFKKNDFHLHIPEGATPKDGPSAGITIASALASLFTGRPVRQDIAMTGEITLQGRVLPIGGLREKAVAAARGHMSVVLCPAGNKADLEEIPDTVKDKLEFRFVDELDDVLKMVLHRKRKIDAA